MKRHGNLWPQVVSFDNLLLAWRKARRGKRNKQAVATFALNLERELLDIQQRLIEQSWKPGEYRLFTIYERKPRQIAAAPFRDRVVHHALMNVVEPLLDKSFIYDSYACRKQKGVHKAVDRYQQWSRRYAYVMKMDISRYFPSIDHILLHDMLKSRIKDKKVLWLFGQIIDHAPEYPPVNHYFTGDDLLSPLERKKGIPIGNLTSQILANLYLNGMDHFIKHELKAKAYLRYVDDLFLLSDDKRQLHDWRSHIEEYLETLRLKLHPTKANLFRVSEGVDVLGYYVYPYYRLLRNDNGFRFSRRLRCFSRGYAIGSLGWDDFNPSVQSWVGHAKQADTYGLRHSIFSATIFKRASGETGPACVARRLVEQQTRQVALRESQQEQPRQAQQQ